MKIFEFNTKGEPCPICKIPKISDAILVPKEGKFDENGIPKCIQVHVDCILKKIVYLDDLDVLMVPEKKQTP